LLPLIFTNTAAAAVFAAACVIWFAPEAIGMFRQRARVSRKAALVQDGGSMAMMIGLQWLGLAVSFWLGWLLPGAAIALQPTGLFLLGVIVILLGVALRWYAIWTLGRYFTREVAVSSDQPVVQDGPYRLIRHPAYSGTLLTLLGVGLALTNWASLIALLVCVLPGYIYRVRIEEQALARAIGQPYVDYMRRTRRFIPLLF
jgi:protein-S-isoprenylcysteine O-methyltransferase Ste14